MEPTYQYWLVRYVPDVARGERVNVAVVVGADGGDWAIQVAPDLRRASRLGGDASVLRPWLGRLEQIFEDYQRPPFDLFVSPEANEVSSSWLELLSHRYNNVLQVSDAAPVEAKSADEAADFLFRILVATPSPVRRSQTRQRLLRDLTALYEHTASLELGHSLLRSPRIRAGKQRGRFDFAVVDGRVDQLSQAFAFDVRDMDTLERELQSWNFVAGRVRQDGAAILLEAEPRLVSRDVQIAVAYQEPVTSEARRRDVFEAALEAWGSIGVRAVPSSQLDVIAREARDLVDA